MTFDNMEGSSSSASARDISSRSAERTNTRKQHRHERATSIYTQALRPRTNLRSPTPRDGSGTFLPTKVGGRLKPWQTKILQCIFDAGIWNPGDCTVELLISELGDRTGKQIKDWFSHRRQLLRESGNVTWTQKTQNKAMALDGLLMLRLRWYEWASGVVGSDSLSSVVGSDSLSGVAGSDLVQHSPL